MTPRSNGRTAARLVLLRSALDTEGGTTDAFGELT